jgi:hypothetical protein
MYDYYINYGLFNEMSMVSTKIRMGLTMSLTAQVRLNGAKNLAAKGSRNRKLHWWLVKHWPEIFI